MIFINAEVGKVAEAEKINLMNATEVAKAIGNFIERCHKNPKQVVLPQWEFTIKTISKVQIEESSLKKQGEWWTFQGTANIKGTDERATVLTMFIRKITGSAIIGFRPNGGIQNDLLPEVEQISITKIEL